MSIKIIHSFCRIVRIHSLKHRIQRPVSNWMLKKLHIGHFTAQPHLRNYFVRQQSSSSSSSPHLLRHAPYYTSASRHRPSPSVTRATPASPAWILAGAVTAGATLFHSTAAAKTAAKTIAAESSPSDSMAPDASAINGSASKRPHYKVVSI